jgi:hypothetical protein
MSLPFPGAIDLAAQSAGIIPGSPLPVLDTEGSSGISALSSDKVTPANSGQDSSRPHQNGDSIPAVGVSVFERDCLVLPLASAVGLWSQDMGLGSCCTQLCLRSG